MVPMPGIVWVCWVREAVLAAVPRDADAVCRRWVVNVASILQERYCCGWSKPFQFQSSSNVVTGRSGASAAAVCCAAGALADDAVHVAALGAVLDAAPAG